ncbi:MAG: DUF4124 domain-containing protein [Gammaproteobacteria bacterium]|nr:DUF4124 domain-containing protein [Gammaproteobacteria bacterium]
MSNKQLISVILLLILSLSVQAQIYKCENEIGEINFSDEPCSKDEVGERLNWLKSSTSSKKKNTRSSVSTQAKKTEKKARKNNEAYVLLSLLTTTQLELETASLRSSLDGETTDSPELMLSDGITINLLKVDKILITYKSGKKELKARFIMDDGYEEVKTVKKPFPKIIGEAKIGRFTKSLEDIKRIEFFNSKKLLKMAGKSSVTNKSTSSESKKALSRKKSQVKEVSSTRPIASENVKNETPVIELDLSHQVPDTATKKSIKKTQIKVVDKKTINHASSTGIQVDFVNEKKMTIEKQGLSSSKGTKKSQQQHFFVSDKEQIPFEAIKTIKIRPTAKNQLLVAVELKTKEIKMEVMSPPFTRIVGKSSSGIFDHSLSDIKSISFQR